MVRRVIKRLKNPEEQKTEGPEDGKSDTPEDEQEMEVMDFENIPGGKPLSAVRFIREYLTEHKESSIYDIYAAYRDKCYSDGMAIRGEKYLGARYSSVRVYVYLLRRYGLIKDVKRAPAKSGWIKHQRKIITMVPGQESHPIWDDLWKYVRARKGLVETSKEEE